MLTDGEIEILEQAKTANPWYFQALIQAAGVMPVRRQKYSGDGDPFTNFHIAGRIMGHSPLETFRWYQALKLARLQMDSGDFADERTADTLRDLANYVLLEAGFRIQQQESA